MLTEYAAVDVGSCGSCIDHNSLLLFLIINNPINIVTPLPFLSLWSFGLSFGAYYVFAV